jgi:hypothetical protein
MGLDPREDNREEYRDSHSDCAESSKTSKLIEGTRETEDKADNCSDRTKGDGAHGRIGKSIKQFGADDAMQSYSRTWSGTGVSVRRNIP